MPEYRITVTNPEGKITYNTFRMTTSDATLVVRDELNLRQEPGTVIAVEVRA